MAPTYTCRVCSREILGRSSILSQAPRATPQSLPSRARRTLATATKPAPAAPAPKATPAARRPIPNSGDPKLRDRLAEKVVKVAPNFTETYKAYGVTNELLQECLKPGEYTIPQAFDKKVELPTDEEGTHIGEGKGWWYETLGLTPTFTNWTQITFLHIYMLQVRLRMFPAQHAPTWVQHLTNHLFWAAEDRLVVYHRIDSNGARQRHLKDMFSNWRAVLLSYDEGLVKGDAVLAAAVWRNLFQGREDVDFVKLAMVVGYLRKEIRRLTLASDAEVASGAYKFDRDPGEEEGIVKRPSEMMMKAMGKEEVGRAGKKA